ncbi:MAG TPA: YCF48-related protein [Steroidobacteraceae bacterium]|nr:YCF48-related protein [Steroidobacteraceae bacterium]
MKVVALVVGFLFLGMMGVVAGREQEPRLIITPALHTASAHTAMILASARAGGRLVAVGAHGVVLLSDDGGKSFHQARFVPVSSTLTGVDFVSARRGWAVGQWGVILATDDGGETWTLQRSDIKVDRPLFSVYFRNAEEGWAVGLWSLMLHTIDGGASWTRVTLPPPPNSLRADRNLYQIFADSLGTLYIACESGFVLRSVNDGANWVYLATGYHGSLWTGVALANQVILVGGLRGHIYRSTNSGTSWVQVSSPYDSSITDMVQIGQHTVEAVALNGVSLVSHDDGLTFTGTQREDRLDLTTAVDSPANKAVVFSMNGPIG